MNRKIISLTIIVLVLELLIVVSVSYIDFKNKVNVVFSENKNQEQSVLGKAITNTPISFYTSEIIKTVSGEFTRNSKILQDANAKDDEETTTTTVSTATSTSSSSSSSSGGSTVPAPSPKPKPTPKPPSPSGCPASTQSCIPCTIGQSYCRYEKGATSGYLGWSCQNNNPGNIRYSSSRINLIRKHGGAAPCGVRYDSRGGTYMIFSTYSKGYGALKAYVKGVNAGDHSAYGSCGNCTLQYFFSKYAPGDPNYDNAVGKEIGVNPETTKLSWVVANKLDPFVNAIKRHEGWFVK